MSGGITGMIGVLVVTILPLGFLIVLFGGGVFFLRNNVQQDGKPPIRRSLFYSSKYAVLAVWGAMVLQVWGVPVSSLEVPPFLSATGLALWVSGFALLYLGRFEMGGSFRLGTPKEQTCMKVKGLFTVSRNPMYVGMYATVVASVLCTLNPVVVALGAFILAVHHSIVLAEEDYLQKVFGKEYLKYRARVHRYI
jgi:protein-S-isoprenylcysteine O-methyltransferase Ste14